MSDLNYEILDLGMVYYKNIIKNNTIGSTDRLLLAIDHPIIGGKAPAAPPITIFCTLLRLSQIV